MIVSVAIAPDVAYLWVVVVVVVPVVLKGAVAVVVLAVSVGSVSWGAV